MSDTHCDQCGGPFSSAHSDPNLRIILAAKDAEIARWIDYSAGLEGERSELIAEVARLQELVREALARCEGIARAHDLGTQEGTRIADGIAALTRSLAPNDATKLVRAFNEWTPSPHTAEFMRHVNADESRILHSAILASSQIIDHGADPAEAMRAETLDECEEIARMMGRGAWRPAADMARSIADAIAALKCKGYGK